MSTPLRKSWTQDEFFAWARAQVRRYEFNGMQPVAMTGGTLGSATIMRNLNGVLYNRLRGKPCQPYGPEAGVETTGSAVRYPDALITCSPQDPDALLTKDVVVVFEIISPHSVHTDRILKVREYAAVASIRRYVLIESTVAGLQVLSRGSADEVWRTTTLTREDVLRIEEVGIEIPVAEIYEGLNFREEDSVSD